MNFRDICRPEDRNAIERVIDSTAIFFPAEKAIALELFDEYMKRGNSSGYNFAFLEDHGQVVGYTCYGAIGLTEGSFDIYWIAVDKALQGAGYGKQLLTHTEELIREQQGRQIYLETSSRKEYAATRGFYLKCGYRLEAQIRDFYAPSDDKCIFVKTVKR